MAGLRTCCSPCHNLLPGGEDERGLSRAPTKGSNTLTDSLTVSWAPIPTPLSTNELFKQFMKAYLKSNQGPSQLSKEHKRLFKSKVPDVYYDKSYMDYYHFYQQCKDHFEISRATKTNRTSFATSFLCGNINVQWT